ncbi:MAG TPA: hypothetical protein VMS65_01075 [Polyangiaceae bacterium]|nr:hypothetical protein [Polyangiaceae bacterium]
MTEPESVRPIAFLLVSAGLMPKHGPYRLYAELARRVAEDGFRTLRFDLGGIGESLPYDRSLPLRARTAHEISAAIDHLCVEHEIESVVLGGLCSGAEDAFRHAEHDRRVVGVVMIDPFAYRTRGWGWRHLLHRAGRRSLRALGRFESLRREASGTGQRPATRLVDYRYMEQSESERILSALLARNVRAHFLYTAGQRERFNHERQLRAMFPRLDFRDRVTLDYLPHIDHTQLLVADRRIVIEAVTRRLADAYVGESRERLASASVPLASVRPRT